MIDQRIKTVSGRIRELRDLSGELYQILAPEQISWEIVRGDLEQMKKKVLEAKSELDATNFQISEAKKRVDDIIGNANMDAEKVKNSVNDAVYKRLNESQSLLDAIKKFCSDVEKRRYAELQSGIKKLEKLEEKE